MFLEMETNVVPAKLAKSNQSRRRLSNKWIVDDYVYPDLYSDLPMQGVRGAHKYSYSSVASNNDCRRAGGAFARSDTHFKQDYDCADLADQPSSPDADDMDSVTSVLSGLPGHLSTLTFTSTTSLSTKDEPPRPYKPPRSRVPTHKKIKVEFVCPELQAVTKCSSPRCDQSSPPGLPTRVNAQALTLWPLPAGDPVLPRTLQAVPYSTAQEVRPPLSPVLQYNARPSPHLPSMSQLIRNTFGTEDEQRPTHNQHATRSIDEPMRKRDDEDQAGLYHLSASFDHSQHAAAADESNCRHISQPDVPGISKDDCWHLGLMRMYQDGPAGVSGNSLNGVTKEISTARFLSDSAVEY